MHSFELESKMCYLNIKNGCKVAIVDLIRQSMTPDYTTIVLQTKSIACIRFKLEKKTRF
jgi:hypothetical protein